MNLSYSGDVRIGPKRIKAECNINYIRNSPNEGCIGKLILFPPLTSIHESKISF